MGCDCGPPSRPTSNIPRRDRRQIQQAPPAANRPSRQRIPCPASQIPAPLPPYTGRPLYLPPTAAEPQPQWPNMRANFAQEVRDYQYAPYRNVQARRLVTGQTSIGKIVLPRRSRPSMPVDQPIPERVPRRVCGPARRAPVQQVAPPRQARPRIPPPPQPQRSAGAVARAPRAAPQAPRAAPPLQPVRSTGAIRRVPGLALRIPTDSPPSPPYQTRARSAPSASRPLRPRSADRRAPPLDAAQLRARQQARELGVPVRGRPCPAAAYQQEYMEDFELMERIAQQEHELRVAEGRAPPPAVRVPCPNDEFDEFEELEKVYEKAYAPTDRVPYMSPEEMAEFERDERETHLQVMEAPSDLEQLIDGAHELNVVAMGGREAGRQERRENRNLRQQIQRQWDANRRAFADCSCSFSEQEPPSNLRQFQQRQRDRNRAAAADPRLRR